ncbi:DUF3786 domain-containing protein [Desulfococcaceae bacterium HSG8]|nr:DUF3786 domain-containing protein [Desulfococcaceae bacterium HSG8]
MTDNYAKIVQENLNKFYSGLSDDVGTYLPACQEGDHFVFHAFGEECRIQPEGIFLGGENQTGVFGILISLYALHVQPEPYVTEPLKAFRDFPNSMPYAGAFTTHTEHILIPHVERIGRFSDQIIKKFRGIKSPPDTGGDFSFVLFPLPKIALCYIFYEADDEFPASVTCLFSNNASSFLPMDAMADIGEYTSRKMLNFLGNI